MRLNIKTLNPGRTTDPLEQRIVSRALRQVARRASALGASLQIGRLDVSMPVSLQRVRGGFFTEAAAASQLAEVMIDQLGLGGGPGVRRKARAESPRVVMRKITLNGKAYKPTTTFKNKFNGVGKEYLTVLDTSTTTYDYKDAGHLERDVKVRQGVVEGMNAGNDGRALRYYRHGESSYLDPNYWTRVGSGLHFKVKTGVKPSAAIRRIFKPVTDDKERSKLECLSQTVAVEYYGILQAIGDAAFDKKFPSITISTRPNVGTMPVKIEKIGGTGDLQPGDWVYFKNHPDYLKKHPTGYWQGENAIYMGKNSSGERMFSGFGATQKTEKKMLESLVKEFNAPPSVRDKASPRYDKKLEKKQITTADIPGILKHLIVRPQRSVSK